MEAAAELLNATACLSQPEAREWFADASKWAALRKLFQDRYPTVDETIVSLQQAEPGTYWFDVRNALFLIRHRLAPLLEADPLDWPLIQRQAGLIVARPLSRPSGQ